MKKYNFIIYILILICLNTKAQRNCGSEVKMSLLQHNNKNQLIKRNIIENKIREEQSKSINSKINSINIPVVVHILYNTNDQNISDEQIYSQIEVLNDDYNRTNSDAINIPNEFLPIAASLQINFCLAKQDNDGNPTSGIIRKYTNNTEFNVFDTSIHYNALGGSNAWNTDNYLNIWISKISNGILGWAQFPGVGSKYTDGVVIDYRRFGTTGTASYPYNLGRTTTHEIGHYFNLIHLWGDNLCGDDWVNDTPTQESANFGCKIHPSFSCNNNGDMFMNFMDYTDDYCMNSFTIGQRNRVWSSISNYRLNLLNSKGCDEINTIGADVELNIIKPEDNMSGCSNPIYPIITIKNKSNNPLYTVTIKYKINNSNEKYQNWSGLLNFNEIDTINLSGIQIDGTSHIIECTAILTNNQLDINPTDNKKIKYFQTSTSATSINVKLLTDNYANENSWILMNLDNELIDSHDSLESNQEYNYNYCLNNGCYKIIINDEFGDGICCDYGNGHISIYREHENSLIGSISTFTYTDTFTFCITTLNETENFSIKNDVYPNPSNGIININDSKFKKDMIIFARVYDTFGRLHLKTNLSSLENIKLTSLKNGIYFIKLSQDEKNSIYKVLINKL